MSWITRSGTLTIVGRHTIFSSNTIGPSQGKVTGMWGTLISKSSCKRSGTSIMVVSSSLSIGSGISAKSKKRRWPKWPTPARVLHGSCTEDMVVLLQTELPYIECQPASAFWWQWSLLSVLLDCNQTAKLLTTSSIPLIRERIFPLISSSTTIPQGKHQFLSCATLPPQNLWIIDEKQSHLSVLLSWDLSQRFSTSVNYMCIFPTNWSQHEVEPIWRTERQKA